MSFAAWITLITASVLIAIGGMIFYSHWEKQNAPTVIITEFNESGQIINTLITKDYKVNSNYIEVIPLDSKAIYILRGSAEIIPIEN